MTIANLIMPRMGGTFAVHRTLRSGLAAHGITLRWVGLGPKAIERVANPLFANEHLQGHIVAGDVDDARAQACQLAEHLTSGEYDGVIINALNGIVQTNIARYLPAEFPKVALVHTTSPGAYAAARSIRDHVHATVGVSPRIVEDLTRWYGFDRERTLCISTAVDTTRFEEVARTAAAEAPAEEPGPLRVLSLGRLCPTSKGTNWLPTIMAPLSAETATLTVAGDGKGRAELERLAEPLGKRIRFMGSVPAAQVPRFMAAADVFLFPSRFEGFGITLIEAMAAGCVPVASHIAGVTDAIIDHEETGLLFPVGDTRQATAHLQRLADDPALRRRLSQNARAAVRDRFALGRMAGAYAGLLRQLEEERPPSKAPLPLERWRVPRRLRPGLRTYLPEPVKDLLRLSLERFLPSRRTPSLERA